MQLKITLFNLLLYYVFCKVRFGTAITGTVQESLNDVH